MQIRPAKASDLELIAEIDGTVESSRYLHLDATGEGMALAWRLEERPARTKLIDPNRLGDESAFALKQIVTGADEGTALLAEHAAAAVALLLARPDRLARTIELIDLRVDYDFRRQGLGTALVYQLIQQARDERENGGELRAVSAATLSNNLPAAGLLAKCGFDLSGVDIRRRSNHDLVKEAVTLFWYAALD
jgi:GNAT superfamily N-acetyltransferase